MKKYERPVVMINEELAEGVYAASGCYVVSCNITQTPELGRGTYCIQVYANHDALHHSTAQELTLYFNQSVTYSSSAGELVGNGENTTSFKIQYNYHNNEVEKIGLGNVYVIADAGLGIPTGKLSCNYVAKEDCTGC